MSIYRSWTNKVYNVQGWDNEEPLGDEQDDVADQDAEPDLSEGVKFLIGTLRAEVSELIQNGVPPEDLDAPQTTIDAMETLVLKNPTVQDIEDAWILLKQAETFLKQAAANRQMGEPNAPHRPDEEPQGTQGITVTDAWSSDELKNLLADLNDLTRDDYEVPGRVKSASATTEAHLLEPKSVEPERSEEVEKKQEATLEDEKKRAAVFEMIKARRQSVTVKQAESALTNPEDRKRLIGETTPTEADRIKYFAHLHSLEGETEVEGSKVKLEGWDAEKFLASRIDSLLEIAKTLDTGSREVLLKEVARLGTAADIRREISAIKELPYKDKIEGCNHAAEGICQRISQLEEGDSLVVPLHVTDGLKGHQVYMSCQRDKGDRLSVRIDNLGRQAEGEHSKDHEGDKEGRLYPLVLADVDLSQLKLDEMRDYFAECLRSQTDILQVFKTGPYDNRYAKMYCDMQTGLNDIYSLTPFKKAGGQKLNPSGLEERGIKARKIQTVGNCVVKNADAGMRDRLGEVVYQRVRREETAGAAKALPGLRKEELHAKLTEKRTESVANLIERATWEATKSEDELAEMLRKKLLKHDTDERRLIVNGATGDQPLLGLACAKGRSNYDEQTGDFVDRVGFPEIGNVLVEMGADAISAAKWLASQEPPNLEALEILASVATEGEAKEIRELLKGLWLNELGRAVANLDYDGTLMSLVALDVDNKKLARILYAWKVVIDAGTTPENRATTLSTMESDIKGSVANENVIALLVELHRKLSDLEPS
jgi:hypothetical protein